MENPGLCIGHTFSIPKTMKAIGLVVHKKKASALIEQRPKL
jgi:hypothetical protein